MVKIIESQKEYEDALCAHKNMCKYTSISFIASAVFGFIGVYSVLFKLTEHSALNWMLLFVCSIVGLIMGVMSLVSFMETSRLEKHIIQYSYSKDMEYTLNKVGTHLFKAIAILVFIVYIAQFIVLVL